MAMLEREARAVVLETGSFLFSGTALQPEIVGREASLVPFCNSTESEALQIAQGFVTL